MMILCNQVVKCCIKAACLQISNSMQLVQPTKAKSKLHSTPTSIIIFG